MLKIEHRITTIRTGAENYMSTVVINGVTVRGTGPSPLNALFSLFAVAHFDRDNWRFRCQPKEAEKKT